MFATAESQRQTGEKTLSMRVWEIGLGSSLRRCVTAKAVAVTTSSSRARTVGAFRFIGARLYAVHARVNCQVELRPVRLDQHLGHFWSRELCRRKLSRFQHLSHLRAREEDVVVAAVRAGLRRGHRTACLAPKRVLEEHRLDVELMRLELVEDQLRVVSAVVVAYTGVVAADDEVGAAVVLTADCVPDRLARTGVTHCGREGGKDDAVGRVIAVEQDAVTLDPRRGGHVVRLRVADQWMDQEAVDRL